MSVYDIDGNALETVYGIDGNVLAQAYDIDGNPLIGSRKPIKHYDYASDPDPDKSYIWNYNLAALQAFQGNKFTIGIQTDTHYRPAEHGSDYSTPLKNMTKQLYFDFITNMGDIPRGWAADTTANTRAWLADMMRRYTSYVESPVFIACGNHDNANNYALRQTKSMSEVISKADLYDLEIGATKSTTTIVEPGNNALYYYKDFPECRVIVLDTNDYPYQEVSDYDVHGNHHTISAAQVAWFTNTALNTDKPVLVISHNVLVTNVLPTMIVPEEDKQYDVACIPYRADQIVSALNNFVQNGGDVVACIAGHIHRQGSAVVDGINHISFGNGGKFAEIVFVDFETRTITTKVIGADATTGKGTAIDRNFTF